MKGHEHFYQAGRAKDGLTSWCRDCNSYSARQSWHGKPPERQILAAAKARADRHGLPFDITEADLAIPAQCPVLGIPLGKGPEGRAHAGSPSVDRIIPERGYVRDNVRVISFRANTIKNDASLAELEAVTEYLRRELAEMRHSPS